MYLRGASFALWFYQNQSYCIGIADVPKNKIMSGKEFKERSGNVPLFKGFSNSMKQHDLQYKAGERAKMTDPKTFRPVDNLRGLHFTDGNNVIWLPSYERIFRITIPDDTFVVCYANPITACKSIELIPEEELSSIDAMNKKIES